MGKMDNGNQAIEIVAIHPAWSEQNPNSGVLAIAAGSSGHPLSPVAGPGTPRIGSGSTIPSTASSPANSPKAWPLFGQA